MVGNRAQELGLLRSLLSPGGIFDLANHAFLTASHFMACFASPAVPWPLVLWVGGGVRLQVCVFEYFELSIRALFFQAFDNEI